MRGLRCIEGKEEEEEGGEEEKEERGWARWLTQRWAVVAGSLMGMGHGVARKKPEWMCSMER